MKRPLSRRTFLRGAGGVAIGVPFLSAMMRPLRSTAQDSIPKRFLVFFSANGTIRERWSPSGTERDFALSEILAPLEAHKRSLLVFDGIDLVTALENSGAQNNHDGGMGHILCARRLMPGPSGFGEFGHLWDGSAGGISLDQEIANSIGESTRFRSLEFGVEAQGIRMPIPSRMCWRAPFEPVPAMNRPGEAFDRIFADVGDLDRAAQIRAQRKSVLDAVMDDYGSLSRELGADDRRKLDAHLTSIREIERRIDRGVGRACTVPERGDASAYGDIGRLQMDLMAKALACDLTRVTSLQWNTAQSYIRFTWLGLDRDHHDISHDGDGNAASVDALANIQRWYAEQFAYLLDRLAEVQEGDGTLLDHSVVLWCNELGRGNNHTYENIPFVVAGSAKGALETGRYLRFDGRVPHGNLYVSLMNALDIPATTFGDPAYCTGPLAGL